jgi:phosphate starvation-inducible PhoH-like protein
MRPACRPFWRKPTSSSSSFEFADSRRVHELFGSHDANVRRLEQALGVEVAMTGDGITIRGDAPETELAGRVLRELYDMAGDGHTIAPEDVERAIDILGANRESSLRDFFSEPVFVSSSGRRIVPKTPNQRVYVEAMRRRDIVFGIGPAGTGKTYLAMAVAVSELLRGNYQRIILTRPAVEAGEKLGFLPGDLAEKVNPYLRPLYDALHDMVSFEKAATMVERGMVEVAPLAFMRGRTLNNAFVILDEAQNTTRAQMKMFLTRLGFDSKAVITGDVTQVDLPSGQLSGLRDAHEVLSAIGDISFVAFSDKDVVRHPLVRAIIDAYDRAGSKAQRSKYES